MKIFILLIIIYTDFIHARTDCQIDKLFLQDRSCETLITSSLEQPGGSPEKIVFISKNVYGNESKLILAEQHSTDNVMDKLKTVLEQDLHYGVGEGKLLFSEHGQKLLVGRLYEDAVESFQWPSMTRSLAFSSIAPQFLIEDIQYCDQFNLVLWAVGSNNFGGQLIVFNQNKLQHQLNMGFIEAPRILQVQNNKTVITWNQDKLMVWQLPYFQLVHEEYRKIELLISDNYQQLLICVSTMPSHNRELAINSYKTNFFEAFDQHFNPICSEDVSKQDSLLSEKYQQLSIIDVVSLNTSTGRGLFIVVRKGKTKNGMLDLVMEVYQDAFSDSFKKEQFCHPFNIAFQIIAFDNHIYKGISLFSDKNLLFIHTMAHEHQGILNKALPIYNKNESSLLVCSSESISLLTCVSSKQNNEKTAIDL